MYLIQLPAVISPMTPSNLDRISLEMERPALETMRSFNLLPKAAAEADTICLLHLLCTPSSISIPHVRRWFYLRRELEDYIADADQNDDRSPDVGQDHLIERQAADEDINYACESENTCCGHERLTDTATEEGEQKACVSGEIWWNLRQ